MKISIGRISLRGTFPYKHGFNNEVKGSRKHVKTNLASGLIETKVMPKLLFAHRTCRINLISKNEEGNLWELLNWKQRVELCLRFGEALKVGTVDKEDYSIHLREVIAPETPSYISSITRSRYGVRCERYGEFQEYEKGITLEDAAVNIMQTSKSARERTLDVSTQIISRKFDISNREFLRR